MAPLPLSFYECFLRTLIAQDNVEFITYNDLMWDDDRNYRKGYPEEWKRWQAALRDGRRSREKFYILLQHDTDTGPVDTLRMADVELRLGIRSSIMTFVRWRRGRPHKNIMPYPIDWNGLKKLEACDFCIGYHCNAMHNANFDPALAHDFFREELETLSGKFDLKFFSAHGGKKGPNGEINNSLDYPANYPTNVRWVHNRFSPRFDRDYSDGGVRLRLARGDETTDLRAWLQTLNPGRHRILIHPQIYRDDDFSPFQADRTTRPAWYNQFVEQTVKYGLHEASKEFWRCASIEKNAESQRMQPGRRSGSFKASLMRMFGGSER